MVRIIKLGLPNIDLGAILKGSYQFLVTNGPKFFNWIVDICGGNPIIAGLVISFPVYLIIDLFYHGVLDKPTATIGANLMKLAFNAVIFIILFVVMHSMWNQ